jgi:5'-deoxynucleotidase
MSNSLYALLYRLRFTPRWSGTYLMFPEDVSQHSHFVSMIAHSLCVIKRQVYGEPVDMERVITLAIYHDSSDAILTHVIAPVKRHEYIKKPFQQITNIANESLVHMVPDVLKSVYTSIFQDKNKEAIEIVQMADQIDALCKAKMELNKGNDEFQIIHDQIEKEVENLALKHPSVRYFLDQFLPSFIDKSLNHRYL